MCFFRKYFEQRKRKKQEAIEKRHAFSRDIPASTLELMAFFADVNVYIDPYHVAQWKEKWSDLIIRTSAYQQRTKKKTPLETETIKRVDDYNEIVSTIDEGRSGGRFFCAGSIRLSTKEPSLHGMIVLKRNS